MPWRVVETRDDIYKVYIYSRCPIIDYRYHHHHLIFNVRKGSL